MNVFTWDLVRGFGKTGLFYKTKPEIWLKLYESLENTAKNKIEIKLKAYNYWNMMIWHREAYYFPIWSISNLISQDYYCICF